MMSATRDLIRIIGVVKIRTDPYVRRSEVSDSVSYQRIPLNTFFVPNHNFSANGME